MSANTTPIAVGAPAVWHAHVNTANTARDGSGTITTVAQGGTNGAVVHSVSIKATGNTRAGVVRLWLKDSSTYRLLDEVLVPNDSVGAAVPTWRKVWAPQDVLGQPALTLGPSQDLAVSTYFNDTFDVVAEGGLY